MMISYPFESQNIGTAANPEYDRPITAQNERDFNKLRYVNGVFQTPTNGLQVTAKGGFGVSVNVGGCHIEGAMMFSDEAVTKTLAAPSGTYDRIDRVVARFDTALDERKIDIHILQGTPATSPKAPELTQEANYYEIALADIRVKRGAAEVTNADITDQRLNSEVCGLVVPAIPTPLDLTDLFVQYQSSLDQFLKLVESALDETVAGNLQNQINALGEDLETLVTDETAEAFKNAGIPID